MKAKWNKKHYKEIKAFVLSTLKEPVDPGKRDPITGRLPVSFREYIQPKLRLMVDCASREDFEGAQATKDALVEFTNRYLPEDKQLPSDFGFNLEGIEPIKTSELTCILCFVETELTSRATWIQNGRQVSKT